MAMDSTSRFSGSSFAIENSHQVERTTKSEMQLKAAPVGRGTFADRRCDNACSSQVAKIRPGAKGQTPAASPHYAHASPASPAPASPTSTRKATAVDREVERI